MRPVELLQLLVDLLEDELDLLVLLLLGSLSLDLLKAVECFGEVILEGVELEPPLALL